MSKHTPGRTFIKHPLLKEETQMNDPWIHRSSNMKCKTCMWYAEKPVVMPNEFREESKIGRCRRHAPTMTGYPVVYPDDWCGDHKLDETKARGEE